MSLRSCRGIQEDRSAQICRKWQNEHEFAKNELVLPVLIDFERIFQVFVLNHQHKASSLINPCQIRLSARHGHRRQWWSRGGHDRRGWPLRGG